MDTLLLVAAGLLAGMLNAVAGGGTFLTLPALVYLGVPPVIANATATVSALPGYVGSALAMRHAFTGPDGPPLGFLVSIGLAGGLAGALLLLVIPEDLFADVVPWLLLVATFIFAAGSHVSRHIGGGRPLGGPAAAALLFAVSVYGGFFNGGLGIVLLAAFALMGLGDIHRMNALKNGMSAVLSLISSVTFAVAGAVVWPHALVLALSATVGGYLGAWLAARYVSPRAIRWLVVVVGLVMAAFFFRA